MAMTLKNILDEFELYEYSQEAFDFMKENNELELLERYLINQLFMSRVYIPENVHLPEGYFMEADVATPNNPGPVNGVKRAILKRATGEYLVKKDGLIGKIMQMIKTFAEKITGFFNKLDNITIALNKDSMTLKERLEMTQLDARAIRVYSYTIWGKGTGVEINNNQQDIPMVYNKQMIATPQPFENQIHLKLANDVPQDENLKAVKWALALALSNTQVALNNEWPVTFAGSSNPNQTAKKFDKAVPLSFLAQMLSDYVQADTITRCTGIVNNVVGKMSNGKPIIIDVSNKNIEHDEELIKKLRDQISNTATSDVSIKFKPQNQQEIAQINQQLQTLRQCATDTLNLYSTYVMARKNITAKLKVLLESANNAYAQDYSKY